jgi:outer membrane protein assembly factor BamC
MTFHKSCTPVLVLLPATLFGMALLSACSSSEERPVYQGAQYYKNLEYPPDLSAPDTTDELRIPEPTKEAMQSFRDNNQLETTITPKFDGIRMVSYAGDSWLEIDNEVEYVWPRVKAFFEHEGIKVVDERPLLGYMETEWTVKMSPDRGFLKSLFQRVEPDQKHKFRVRLARIDDSAKTRMHITHSQIERVMSGEYNEDVSWVTRPGDLEVERELLSRMALFAGLDKEQGLALLENYRPYSSLIRLDKDDTTSLTMTGSMDFVWRRSLRALDRMRMKEIREDRSASTIYFVVGKIQDEDLAINQDGEEDELAESSWLMRLITGDEEPEELSGQYRLELSREEGRVRITVRDESTTVNTDDDGSVYSSARVEQIRDALVRHLE